VPSWRLELIAAVIGSVPKSRDTIQGAWTFVCDRDLANRDDDARVAVVGAIRSRVARWKLILSGVRA
jgi:hypothetical protein